MNTTQTPASVQPPGRPEHSRTFRVLRAGGIGFAALIVIGGTASALAGGHGPTAAVRASAAATPEVTIKTWAPVTPVTSAPASVPAATTQAPATTAPAAATQAPAPPAITTSQQQALDSAQSYLALGSGFSRTGLIDQLRSQAGEGFPLADATWAADHSGADWNAQAVLAAKGYMNLGTGFSRQGLIGQLDSPYGGQFTYAQAVYAADKVGL